MKVETEKEDEVLDCSIISRSEKNSLDTLVSCPQETNKRKRTSFGCDGSLSHQEILTVKKRSLTQEVNPLRTVFHLNLYVKMASKYVSSDLVNYCSELFSSH